MLYRFAAAKIIQFVIVFSILLYTVFYYQPLHGKIANATVDRNYSESNLPFPTGPIIIDPNLKTEVVFRGLTYPTDFAFLDSNDILVIEKDTGIVRRIVNNTMMKEPLLDVNVATFGHRGMLGIAVSSISSPQALSPTHAPPNQAPTNDTNNRSIETWADDINASKYVFLYYTAIQGKDGEDITQGKQPLGNFVYRYRFVDNMLVEPKLLLKLPSTPGAIGNGGKILVNPYDNNLYITIGGVGVDGHETKAQNVMNGGDPDGTSGILVMTQDGKPVSQTGVIGDKDPTNKYYAYGIWNSFGIDFDSITGKLWDTENGVIFGDEVNLVEPGFNSRWNKIDGIWLRGYPIEDTEDRVATNQTKGLLVDFNGKGKYSPPEFTWFNDVGPTAIRFFSSDKLGDQYQDDIFVSITDIEVGPGDGYLYILTFNDRQGTIYRITTNGGS